MISEIRLKNFGPLGRDFQWNNTGAVNLIIGENATGKTFLLKALYSAVRTIETFHRGNDKRKAQEILADKLYWTYEADKIGDIVSKNADGSLSFSMKFNNTLFSYQFGKDAEKKFLTFNNETGKRDANSVFIPAKEVLSLNNIILETREQNQIFGFDDTYYDLAKAIRISRKKGKVPGEFSKARNQLKEITHGRIEFDETNDKWKFKDGDNQLFDIGVTAEGIKKAAILDVLLGNRYLSRDSIVFIDELESALHPRAISSFIEIITLLAAHGMQFFISSHSYFTVKKLAVEAQRKKAPSFSVLSASENVWHESDLKYGLPKNSIIDESIRLYKEELGIDVK